MAAVCSSTSFGSAGCMGYCLPLLNSSSQVSPLLPDGSPLTYGDNLWCRFGYMVGVTQGASWLCPIAGPTGTGPIGGPGTANIAMCAPDYTANFAHLWHVVPGYCVPGTSIGQCCCFTGVENVTRTTYMGLGYNVLSWVAPTSGGAACLNNDVLAVPMFIDSPTHAGQLVPVSQGGTTVTLGIDINIDMATRHGNQYKVALNLLGPQCAGTACIDPHGNCLAPGSSSTGPEGSPSTRPESSLALVAVLGIAAGLAYFAF
jgi:hypothetical protein